MNLSGLMIVRKPRFVTLFQGDYLKPVNGVFYHGLERNSWADVDKLFFNQKLPVEWLDTYKYLSTTDNDFTGIRVAPHMTFINKFLTVNGAQNELITIASPTLSGIKGQIHLPDEQINWLGYDIVLLGGWSLIRHAIFENRITAWGDQASLNEFGLLENPGHAAGFVEFYKEMGDRDFVDPIPGGYPWKVDVVRVGRVINL